ncbi:MAG: YqaA family protein [archaeon]|jgi:membrane protein YqaA with SNARE-associated domain
MNKLGENTFLKTINYYTFGKIRKLYDWTLSWAETKYGALALFVLAFAESSFFPIPPDILLIALCVSIQKKSFKYAAICTIGSVLGGLFGYFIGYSFYEYIGVFIIQTLNYQQYFSLVGQMYVDNAFFAILAAALTPIPYKVFTIAAGVWHIDLVTLITASILGRGFRFFLVAGLIFYFGKKIKTFIDKYFNILITVGFLLLIGGFLILKYFT